MLRWIAAHHAVMDPQDLKAIIDVALRTLQKMPMTIDGTDDFFGLLADFGCEVSGMKVRFPQAVIDETMARIARHKQTHGAPLREPPREVTCSVSGQALFIAQTEDDKLRKCSKQDLAVLSRVVDAIPGLGRSHPSFIPQDAPLNTQELHAFGVIILNSKQPCRVSLYSPEALPHYLRILEVVCGSKEAAAEKARELNPCKVWVNSPMMISRENIEAPMLLRELTGQPLRFAAMPVAGMATPVTAAGALAFMAAETIACNAISLAVDNRVVGWCDQPVFFDMKTAVHTQYGPEVLLLNAGERTLRRELFGHEAPIDSGLGTAAKKPGVQSMMEVASGIGFNYAVGARSFGGLGTLAHSDIYSTVQLMLCLEVVGLFAKASVGFEVNEGTLAEELIAEVAPTGARFIDTDHTAKRYREVSWFPELLDRRVPMSWVESPSDTLEAARAKALDLERTAPNRCPLDETEKAAIREILDAADRALG